MNELNTKFNQITREQKTTYNFTYRENNQIDNQVDYATKSLTNTETYVKLIYYCRKIAEYRQISERKTK